MGFGVIVGKSEGDEVGFGESVGYGEGSTENEGSIVGPIVLVGIALGEYVGWSVGLGEGSTDG